MFEVPVKCRSDATILLINLLSRELHMLKDLKDGLS